MSVIQIRKAQRAGARLVVSLSGVSGSGKTRTAIELAYGLANYRPEKIGFLDTENRRGSLYADCLWNHSTHPTREPFLIGDLVPPFSPQRYIDAIEQFQRAGVEVLIVDSGSHEWEGEGGCQAMAEAGNPKMPNWNLAKKEHKRFVNKLLQCDMHIIVCLRAREKSKPEKVIDPQSGREKSVYVDLGLQPITEKNFIFEMTASLLMHEMGRRQEVTKCPEALVGILGRGQGYITAADGAALRAWVDGGQQLDPRVEKWRNSLLSNAEKGLEHIRGCWAQTPEPVQAALGEDFQRSLFASAEGFDQQRELEAGGGLPPAEDEGIASLNDEIAAEPVAAAAAPAAEPHPAAAAPAAAPAGRRARTAASAPAETAPPAAVRQQPAPAAADTQPAPAAAVAPASAAPAPARAAAARPAAAPAAGPVDLF